MVPAQEKRAAQLERFKDGTEANKKFKQLFMEKKYEEVAKLFLPLPVVEAVKEANVVSNSTVSYKFPIYYGGTRTVQSIPSVNSYFV